MQDFSLVIKPIVYGLLACLLFVSIIAVAYLAKSIYKVSRIISRIEMLTDVKGWFGIFRSLSSFGSKKKSSKEE